MTNKFCVMTVGRSGSTSLMEALERFDDIAVPNRNVDCGNNELLYPRDVQEFAKRYSELCKHPVRNPDELIDAFYEVNAAAKFAGFKTMPNRHKDYRAFVTRPDIRFITLNRRDVPSTAASFFVAEFLETYRRRGEAHDERYRFDPGEHGPRVAGNVGYIHECHRRLKRIPNAIHLHYEDLCNPSFVPRELDEYFGRPIRLANPKPPVPGSSYIENWDEFEKFTARAWQKLNADWEKSFRARRPAGAGKGTAKGP